MASLLGLMNEMYHDEVRRARAMTPVERLRAGLELFEMSLAFTRAGVRDQLAIDDEDTLDAAVCDRFERVRESRERGLYRPLGRRG